MFDSVEVSEIARNWAIVIGGTIGLVLAFWRGLAHSRQARAQAEQARIARRDHVTDVYNQAVGMLGEEKLEVRLGAMYTLVQIHSEFQELHHAVVDLLQAYVRERATVDPGDRPGVDIGLIVKFLHENLAETETTDGY
jgi:uncharacterized protein YqgV (UPF0045/DUF77 family)